MVDRKAMYVPAPSLLDSATKKRKTLAQGVLIADESLDETHWMRETAKREVNIFVSGTKPPKLTTLLQENDTHGTPRKLFSGTGSPISKGPSIKPAHELSISESDDDNGKVVNGRSKRFSYQLPEVTVIDATGPRLNENATEVVTKQSVQYSPAKVVCHSPPSADKKKYKERGIPDLVNIDSGKTEQRNILARKGLEFKTEQNSLEGSPLDRNSSAYPVIVNDNSSSDENSRHQGSLNQTKLSDTSDAPRSGTPQTRDKKGKKQGKVVKSRYMESVARKDKQVKGRNQDSANNSKEFKPSLSTQKSTRATNQVKTKVDSSLLQNISAIAPHPGKVYARGQQTSTPYWAILPDRPSTSFATEGSFMEIARSHKEFTSKTGSSRKKDSSFNADQASGIADEQAQAPSTVNEAAGKVLDRQVRYTRMLQAAYLKEKAMQAFDEQQKDAMNQLHAFWKENENMKDEIQKLKQAHEVKEYSTALDQILNAEASGLGSTEGVLKKFEKSFRDLAGALENAQLFMPLQDMIVTNPERLQSAFEESKALLDEINDLTEQKADQLSKLSQDFEMLNRTAEVEIKEQDSCTELLSAAVSLAKQEQSLQAAIIERNYRPSWDFTATEVYN